MYFTGVLSSLTSGIFVNFDFIEHLEEIKYCGRDPKFHTWFFYFLVFIFYFALFPFCDVKYFIIILILSKKSKWTKLGYILFVFFRCIGFISSLWQQVSMLISILSNALKKSNTETKNLIPDKYLIDFGLYFERLELIK